MQLMHPKTSVSYQQWETCVSSKKGGEKGFTFSVNTKKKTSKSASFSQGNEK